jgi:hypothetical protein
MKTQNLDTQEAPVKWFAYQDARQRNLSNKSHHSEAVKLQVDRMLAVMDLVYATKGVYEAYGRRGVSVKVNNPVVKNRKALKELEAQWESQGFVKRISAQGITYRLNISVDK